MNLSPQLPLPMLTLYKGPRLLPAERISEIRSYRDAVLVCWANRTRAQLAQLVVCDEVSELTEGPRMRSSHLTEYLSRNTKNREMPARFITAFEISMGNRAITQWLTRCADLHHLEQMIEQQRHAA